MHEVWEDCPQDVEIVVEKKWKMYRKRIRYGE